MRLTPKLHYCMDGIAVNPRSEVLSTTTLAPIPGLYAAGEVTGGVHGMDRLGGCSSVDCMVFGLEAGRNAAAFTSKHRGTNMKKFFIPLFALPCFLALLSLPTLRLLPECR